jgi:phosphatidylinositol alpha-mannosyltransferase
VKVAIVCPYDWSHPGGVRSHIIGLRRALEETGVAVEVIAPAGDSEPGIVAVGRSQAIPANGSVARLCFSRSARRRVAERLERGDIDVVHVHEPAIPSVSLLALMGSPSCSLPSVATFHAAAPRSTGYALARPLLGRWVRRIDVRIAVSEAARGLIGAYFPGEYRIVPNGVDVSAFAGAVPDPELEELKPFVLFVGRPEPRKGFAVLLRAMDLVRRDRPRVRLVWAGAAPEGLPEWVVSLGPVPQERLAGAYAAADVFCAPSIGGESFGIILAESMAAGTPVVCSDLPGYREAAADAAVFVPPGDDAAVARALLDLMADADRAGDLVERGRKRVAALDWKVVAADVMTCYEDAVGGR